jgi:hypothetical protein
MEIQSSIFPLLPWVLSFVPRQHKPIQPWRLGALDIASASGMRRPGFESRRGIRFLGKHSSAVVYKMTYICNMHCLCVKRGLATKIYSFIQFKAIIPCRHGHDQVVLDSPAESRVVRSNPTKGQGGGLKKRRFFRGQFLQHESPPQLCPQGVNLAPREGP